MDQLKNLREAQGLSQRALAARAGIAYKTVQLIETGHHDPRVSTLDRIAQALGYPRRIVNERLRTLWESPPDSVAMVSERIVSGEPSSWKGHVFDFVDAFRRSGDPQLIKNAPVQGSSNFVRALLAATVESLCRELNVVIPNWCHNVGCLNEPTFVAGIENLKAMSLVESPLSFRRRNIFVLGNFLARA